MLGLLPGAVAAVAGLNWPSLVLLPGLVAAGAGLLFGVNAFCLDGSGAVWLTSLPGRPATAFWSKTRVVLEICTVATVLTVCAGGIRSGRLPTAAEVAAVASCAVVSLLRVLATCMDLSVTRPHRADLRGPRNTPAPPGVMAAYSARLAVSTTLVAVLFSVLADVAPWRLAGSGGGAVLSHEPAPAGAVRRSVAGCVGPRKGGHRRGQRVNPGPTESPDDRYPSRWHEIGANAPPLYHSVATVDDIRSPPSSSH